MTRLIPYQESGQPTLDELPLGAVRRPDLPVAGHIQLFAHLVDAAVDGARADRVDQERLQLFVVVDGERGAQLCKKEST